MDQRRSGLGVKRPSDTSELAQPVEARRASVRDVLTEAQVRRQCHA